MDETTAQDKQDVPDAAEYEEVETGSQQVVQAKVHGEQEDYPLEDEEEEGDEDDEEDDDNEDTELDDDPEWDAEVARQQEIGVLKIQVRFTSSG